MNAPSSIVNFGNVTVPSSSQYETGLLAHVFRVEPGAIRCWCGLSVKTSACPWRMPPKAWCRRRRESSVSWAMTGSLSADRAAARRGKIGRLFEDEGWISDLDVDENIVLAQRHHTQRTDHDVLEEALQLARMFGLPGLPRGRPGQMRRWDLRKAACIRAFLGQPTLTLSSSRCEGFMRTLSLLCSVLSSPRARAAPPCSGRPRTCKSGTIPACAPRPGPGCSGRNCMSWHQAHNGPAFPISACQRSDRALCAGRGRAGCGRRGS